MIVGIGIDAVEIKRFEKWSHFTHQQLLRIFSSTEIDYCFSSSAKAPERLAARFAAREALYKALHHLPLTQQIPFLTLCKKIYIAKNEHEAPIIICDWRWLKPYLLFDAACTISLSITHTKTTAMAFVTISSQSL